MKQSKIPNVLKHFDQLSTIIQAQCELESFTITLPETKELMIWFLNKKFLYNHSEMNLKTQDLDSYTKNQQKYIIVKNIIETWEYVLSNKENSTDVDSILNFHYLLTKNLVENAGDFRNKKVKITGTNYIPPLEINNEHIRNLENLLNKNDSIDITLYIMKTQLFNDGNKRTGYFTLTSYLLKENKILNLSINNTTSYIRSIIHYYNTNDDSLFRKFVKENTIDLINTPEKLKQNEFKR